MDIWIISNLLAILNNAVVRILEHISLCLCLRISVGYKPRRRLLGQRICISSTLLKSLQSEWISIVYLTMYESSLCSTFLPTFGIINLFIFIKLMGMMSHYDADFNFPNYQQSLSSYHIFIGQSSFSFYGILLHPLPMFLCGCLFLIIPWMVNINCKYLLPVWNLFLVHRTS